jgi:hypothetical protein
MKKSDRELGMDREINRRDFLRAERASRSRARSLRRGKWQRRGTMPDRLRPQLQVSINL